MPKNTKIDDRVRRRKKSENANQHNDEKYNWALPTITYDSISLRIPDIDSVPHG
jgi:hypothetical protein